MSDKTKGNLIRNYGLWLVLLIAAALRIWFYSGHIFSDDSYYVKVAFDAFSGGDISYLGYPVLKNRLAETWSLLLVFRLFGTTEIATIIFPFLCSLGSVILTYKFALHFYNENKTVAFTSSVIMAIIPTDIIFATIAFTDLQSAFFFYLSIYLLLLAVKRKKVFYALIAGLSGTLALMYKFIILYGFVLLFLFAVYLILQKKIGVKYFLTYFFVVIGVFILESLVNGLFYGDPFRRLHLMEMNYSFSWYDFYPGAVSTDGETGVLIYLKFFGMNLKYIFLRRFYLFLPLIALIPAIFNLKSGKSGLVSSWYIGLLLLFLFFSTSMNSYRPMSLEQSWYLFPLFIPVSLIAGEYFTRFSQNFRTITFSILLIFSIYMCVSYQHYFDIGNKNDFKSYLQTTLGHRIFTDHHTKYGIDLMRGYNEFDDVKLPDKIEYYARKGDLVIISDKKINELKLQGFKYNFEKYNESFKESDVFGEFRIYKITRDFAR